MTQSVSGTWDALYAALQGMFPTTANASTLVSPGEAGEYQPDLLIEVMGVRAPITQPTFSTNRSRDKRIQIDVIVSAYRHGGPEVQQLANQAAWTAADLIEAYFRVNPHQGLGGACYNAFVTEMTMTPSIAWETESSGYTNAQGGELLAPVASGRVAEVTVVVEAWIRI